MGIEFRSGGYTRRVTMGGRTIKDGEAAAIWDFKGRHRQVIGPSRQWMWCSTIRFLTRHKAESHQYILVHHRNGKTEHMQGPAELYEDPALYDAVKVIDGIHLRSDKDCIIVYRERTAAATGQAAPGVKMSETSIPVGEIALAEEALKRVVRGPTLFMPAVGEVVHEFKWSGVTSESEDAVLKAKKSVFKVLHVDSNRSWSVRFPITTSDAMKVTAHLVFGYDIESIDKVAQAEDPIAKMYAGLVADAQKLGATVASEQLRAGQQAAVTAKLETLANFGYLGAAAAGSGMRLTGVRVLGLKFSAELQEQADREQKLAAGLRAELAEKTQRRELRSLELENERKKIEEEAELERKRAEARAQLEEEAHGMKRAEAQRRIELERVSFEAQLRAKEQDDARLLSFLRALNAEGVDMTAFMCSPAGRFAAAPALGAHAQRDSPEQREAECEQLKGKGKGAAI